MNKKTAIVLGGGGFIGGHLIEFLKKKDYYVVGVDLKENEYQKTSANNFIIGDLRDATFVNEIFKHYFGSFSGFDEVYQLAADMGGAGYIFSGENDANVMHNSAMINLNVADASVKYKAKKVFYSSSACIYPEYNQLDPKNPICEESSAYPAAPDSEYGWEKLFSERLFAAYSRNYNLDVRVARFHNIFGPYGSWNNGKEKSPAAICRKVAEAKDGGEIEIWGDGEQTRSFLYVDECLEAIRRIMDSDFKGPVNIGSEEMVTINQLVDYVSEIAGKTLIKKHIEGPLGVRGRTSSNKLIHEKINWSPNYPLKDGLKITFSWINSMVNP